MNMQKKYFFLLIVTLCVVFATPLLAVAADSSVDAYAILTQSDVARGNTGGLIWDVTIQSTEKLVLSVKAKGADSRAEYKEPNTQKGQILLMKKNNMWFIKPGVSKPVSISPRQRLIGAASNADIASTNYAGDYNPAFLGFESVNDIECYLFDLKAKNASVTYDRIKYWVSKDKNLGVKAEFYSVSGKLLKTAFLKYNTEVEINGEKRPFISEMAIHDAVVKDSVTMMSYNNIKVTTISDAEFNITTVM